MSKLVAALASAALVLSSAAIAQDKFPSRPVTLIVPFAAGGSTDIVARLVAAKMSEGLGQQVIVENRAGAGGNLGANLVAKASPDGYTILMGTVATHALNPAMSRKMPYDAVADFAPVSLLAIVPNVLIVNNNFPAKSVKELIAELKKAPGRYSYASSGLGTPLHLSGEMFKTMTGTDMVHVPYRGSGPALTDLMAGQVQIQFDNLPSASQLIAAGKVRGLAVTTKERAASMPDLPTMDEAGIAQYETYTWNALFAPAKTPKEVVARLNAEANKALSDPNVQARMKEYSATVVGSTPEQLASHVRAELAKWDPIAKATGATID